MVIKSQLGNPNLKFPILLDTGILVLYLVGKIKFDKLSIREKIEFSDLDYFLSNKEKYVTPHILAEFSNIIAKRYKECKETILILSSDIISKSFEIFIPKESIFKHEKIGWLGVADISLLEACDKKFKKLILLTLESEEKGFYQFCKNKGYGIISLSEIKKYK